MRIDSLTLQNFQGVRDLTIDFGPDAEIRGGNATGKTTIANAITWLLTGKSLDGEKGYSPKPKGPDGIDIHNLETSVIADVVLAPSWSHGSKCGRWIQEERMAS